MEGGDVRCHLSSQVEGEEELEKVGTVVQWSKDRWERAFGNRSKIIIWVKAMFRLLHYPVTTTLHFWWASVSWTWFFFPLSPAMFNTIFFLNFDIISLVVVESHNFNEICFYFFYLHFTLLVFIFSLHLLHFFLNFKLVSFCLFFST